MFHHEGAKLSLEGHASACAAIAPLRRDDPSARGYFTYLRDRLILGLNAARNSWMMQTQSWLRLPS
jgi:hypothetical protein